MEEEINYESLSSVFLLLRNITPEKIALIIVQPTNSSLDYMDELYNMEIDKPHNSGKLELLFQHGVHVNWVPGLQILDKMEQSISFFRNC